MAERARRKGAIGKIEYARQRWLLFSKIQPATASRPVTTNGAGGFSVLVAGFLLSWIAVVAGLWPIAGESLPLSRLFDGLEVGPRRLARLLEDVWAGVSPAERGLLLPVMLLCAAAVGYAVYNLHFGR